MTSIQCPMCKNEFEIELDISVKTKGLTVFRGKMAFLGTLGDVNDLLGYVQRLFSDRKRLSRCVLIHHLVRDCSIPAEDAHHLVRQLHREGFMYEPSPGNLSFVGGV